MSIDDYGAIFRLSKIITNLDHWISIFIISKTLAIFTKKPKNLKKTFCFNFYPCQSSAKCFHIWFEISKVASVEKREPRKHFSASACSFLGLDLRPRPQKCGLGFKKLFLDSLFSTSVTLDKSQIRLGQIFPQTW